MRLLSQQKERESRSERLEKKRIEGIIRKQRLAQEEKRLSELDLDEEQKKLVTEFSLWNKAMQEKKAILMVEIEALELKKEELISSIKNLC